MEATGDYWKPVYFVLESRGFDCQLYHAAQSKPCRRLAGGVSAGLVPPGLGLPSPGVGLRSSDVGDPEGVAVEVGLGVGGCATETAAPTTVSRAAAAQMIWARRRKLVTLRRRSATMERTIGRERWRRIITLRTVVRGRHARPSLLPTADRDRGRSGRSILAFAHSRRRADVVSRVRSDPLPARIQLGRRQAEPHRGVGGYAVPGPL